MLNKLKPYLNRVLVKRLPPKDITCGGIIIGEPTQNPLATVIAIGTTLKSNIAVGDVVYIGLSFGIPVEPDVYLFREEEILGQYIETPKEV